MGVRNVKNHAPTLAEGWLAMAFDAIKFLYKYCFNSPCVTHWLSTTTLWRSKTYCFALQKRRFCKVKAAVLQCKTYAFGKRKKKHWFSVKIFRYCSKGETICANHRFLLATEATQRHVRAYSSRFYTENTNLFSGYRFTTFAVRNAMNHSLHCQTKRQKTEKHHKKFAKSNKNY